MTQYYGVNQTRAFQTVPSVKIPPGEQAGRVRCAYDEFTVTAALTTSDNLRMMKLPSGARILDVVVSAADLGGTGTMNIGWSVGQDIGNSAAGGEDADPNGFFDALDLSGQAVVASMVEAAVRTGVHKKFADSVFLELVPAANFSGTSGTITLAVYYILD